MADCLFCKVRDGQIPAKLVYEDDRAFAFPDIQPQAPTHVLICPRPHIATLNDLTDADAPLAGHLFVVAAKLAKNAGLADAGWRAAVNVNRGGGQHVFHVHLHLLGGRPFGWPPG
jgi:histidine triad (HIT) family protein